MREKEIPNYVAVTKDDGKLLAFVPIAEDIEGMDPNHYIQGTNILVRVGYGKPSKFSDVEGEIYYGTNEDGVSFADVARKRG